MPTRARYLAMGCVCSLVPACRDRSVTSTPDPDPFVAIVGVGKDDPVWTAIEAATADAATQLAAGRYALRAVAPENRSIDEQKKILRRLQRTGLAAACVVISDPAAMTDVLRELADSGVRVVTLVRSVSARPSPSHFGLNDDAIGQAAATAACQAAENGGLVALLHADSVDPASAQRHAACIRALARCPKLRLLRKFDCAADPDAARTLLRDAAKRFPRIDVWIVLGDWPLRNADPTEPLVPPSSKLIAVDAFPSHLAFVDAGTVGALVASDYRDMMTQAVMTAVAELSGAKPSSRYYDAPVAVVTRQNLKQYLRSGFAALDEPGDTR